MVVAAARVAAGEVVVGALVSILVPVVGLVQVAVLLLLLLAAAGAMLQLLLLLLAVGAALLLAVGAALLLLLLVALLLLLVVAVGAALLLLAADGRGAALHLTESIETKCKDLVNITNWSTYS